MSSQRYYLSTGPSTNRLSSDYNRSVESSNDSSSYNGEDWCRPRAAGQGLEDIFSEEIRLRSSEMLETDDMQRLLKTFGIGVNTVGTQGGFGQTDESCYGYSIPYQAQIDNTYRRERNRGSGKAVVGWLKLKAALRWGIFIRKKAAERRPQIVEID
ncbi:PREDICTED: calmodulin-binding protein 60 E-like [Camelina sativa]|uniref:Calmodulin-binding protein 60 E-like n=1 Tax=Camelina sativa TaxID=90675 RepID=A0ABM0T166_CAMSA|nr:PREDICTED: calmodulin-binding protein 60 E-like [Camelina sativa]XP_010419300.1 PREDICTED: calmodulin-binding protein 60 E-like [Camelina sativa]